MHGSKEYEICKANPKLRTTEKLVKRFVLKSGLIFNSMEIRTTDCTCFADL